MNYQSTTHYLCLIFIWLLTPFFFKTQAQSHWETIVSPGTTWDYVVPSDRMLNSWKDQGFDASSWSQGPSGIGYGDGDDATIIDPAISVYMRKEFQIIDLFLINRVVLDIDYDDGYIAYLNGVEIGRDQLTGDNISYNTSADGYREAMLYQGNTPERIFVDLSLLQNGTNTLAVQVHNYGVDSSDMTALPVLSVEVLGSDQVYDQTPVWFQDPDPAPVQYNFTSSNLPIVFLDTDGSQDIPNEPKISAQMKIIKRPNGERNLVSDADNPTYFDFNGPIQIEIRGSSSQYFSKKQYALTTYNNLGDKENVNLLDMPRENDWILSGLAFDTAFVRDYVSYKLSNSLDQYAARAEYCELVLNGEYKGIYMLLEKLKADDSRINIKKLDIIDNELPNLSGGYISKSDKIEGEEILGWTMDGYGWGPAKFAHEQPKPTEVTSQQDLYIQQVFSDLASTSSLNNTSLTEGYPSLIDIPSFVDFIIMAELTSNPDSYMFSTFFHKDRRGKLRAGPVWDYNLTFGNDLLLWGFDRSKTDIWQIFNGNMGATFWQDLFNDPYFKCYFTKRWNEVTAAGQPLSENKIHELIDQTVTLIDEAVSRQNELWTGVDIEFDTRIANMKNFVSQRIAWISSQLSDTSLCDQITTPPLVISKINYHPNFIDEDNYEFIEVTNNSNSQWDLTGVYFGRKLGLSYQFPAGFNIAPYQSVVIANNADVFSSHYGFSPFDEYSRKLSNGSEEITLLDGFGNLIDRVVYDDEAPWPTQADGGGGYLNLSDLNADNSLPTSWTASFDYNSLSLDDEIDSRLFVYPNPVNKYVHVSLTNGNMINKVNVYSMTGKLITSYQSNKNRDIFNLESLATGAYFMEVITDSQTFTKRIIRK